MGTETLAAILGVPLERVVAYETGRRLPPLLTLIRMAETFDIGLDTLISEKPKKAPVTNQQLLECYREMATLSKEDQDAILEFLWAVLQAVRVLRKTKV